MIVWLFILFTKTGHILLVYLLTPSGKHSYAIVAGVTFIVLWSGLEPKTYRSLVLYLSHKVQYKAIRLLVYKFS